MFKLLLVDDEPIERDGMQAILQHAFQDMEIKQAKNGKIAVEIVAQWKPDVVFMDIMMPTMNGLEAIEEIRQTDKEIEFVMMTAFDTFDYARQAIKLGVKDYLLKPSKAGEIVATADKLFMQLKQKIKESAQRQQEQEALQKALAIVETDIVTQLLFDHVHEMHIDLLVEMLETQPAEEKFVMTVHVPEGAEHFYADIKEKISKGNNVWMGACYDNHLPLIVFRNPLQSLRSQAITLANGILALTDRNEGWFVGIGTICESLDDVRNSYQKSLIAMLDLKAPSRYRFYSDELEPIKADVPVFIKQQEKRLVDFVRLGEWEAVEGLVLNVIRQLEHAGEKVLRTQQRSLEFLWLTTRVMAEIGIEAETPLYSIPAKDYRQLMSETLEMINGLKKIYMTQSSRMEFDKIHKIKQFITEHSHEDISLDILARKVDLSPIYISKMFKEKLGINYIDFLTECRIEKAKKLLADPKISLKAIALEVGYHEPNYFSKVFRKMNDISPTEYRMTLLNAGKAEGSGT
ncbi:response regulator [Planococcus sp. ISL-109]|uniref:response regulator n=1 Tax=Planococcus sp. ISL-109 TaxID=2819166 RepID=UPI001BEA80D0|nr:response regulator [Planococcus sp. ISL-109]MBT2583922.1 response regulator [Planococcus sp. ISL-109]